MDLTEFQRGFIPDRFLRSNTKNMVNCGMSNISFSNGFITDIVMSNDGHIKQFIFRNILVRDRNNGIEHLYSELLFYYPLHENENDLIGYVPEYDNEYINNQITKQFKEHFLIFFSIEHEMDMFLKMLSKNEVY